MEKKFEKAHGGTKVRFKVFFLGENLCRNMQHFISLTDNMVINAVEKKGVRMMEKSSKNGNRSVTITYHIIMVENFVQETSELLFSIRCRKLSPCQ